MHIIKVLIGIYTQQREASANEFCQVFFQDILDIFKVNLYWCWLVVLVVLVWFGLKGLLFCLLLGVVFPHLIYPK
jgi:hypothetical protein